jgi:hypothetical protein
MSRSVGARLRRLERLLPVYGNETAQTKREVLGQLAREQMPDAEAVLRLHESLLFLRAYPDDVETSALVERLLSRFERRADLRAHRDELVDSGIVGTPIYYAFYWATARWLTRRWPDRLSIDWDEFEGIDRLDGLLPLLASHSEAPAIDAAELTTREWIDRMRGPGESDAACLIRLFERIPADDFWRERLFESLETPFTLTGGPSTPSRTLAHFGDDPIVFQTRRLVRKRPDLHEAIARPTVEVKSLSVAQGRQVVDLAREAMVTRSRDLDVFANGDARDVRMVDCGDGLQFACIGVLPERRLLLESVYGFLTLKNGVPIGYVLTGTLFNSAEVAYNVFETYRGAEAGYVYGQVLSMTHQLFGADCFSVDPYQLGHHNAEGLGSGAWWFYYKFGFRAYDAGVRRVAREELRRMKADPGHRSSRPTLKKLVVAPVFWHQRKERADVLGRFPLGNVGLKITDYLSRRFGGRRKDGEKVCAEEAAGLLGVRSVRSFSPGERVAWRRWAPLVLILPGIERWNASDRRELVKVIRAKGGRRESDFVTRFDRHTKLRRAIVQLGRGRG